MHLTPEGQQKRQDGEDIEQLSVLHALCHQTPCAIQKWADIFSGLPFVADTAAEALLITLVLNVPCQIKLQVSFGFADPLSAFFLQNHLSLLRLSLCFPLMSDFC